MVHEKENHIAYYLFWEGWFKIQHLKNPGKNIFQKECCLCETG